MRVAVTGASGFIGRYVVAALLERGYSVVTVSREDLRGSSHTAPSPLEQIFVDIHAPDTRSLEEIASTDACIHLAWGSLENFNSIAHVRDEFPLHVRFLNELLDRGLKRLVVSGTCLEYGLKHGALPEDAATAPVTPYGLAKDALRRSLEFHPAAQARKLVWARLFYLYGECPGRRTLFMQIKEAAERGDREFAMSAGEQLRDYLPVTEVAAQLVALSVAPSAHGIYNVCSGRPISVRRLVEQWIAEHGWTISLKLGVYPYPAYEPLAFWGDDRRIQGLMYPET